MATSEQHNSPQAEGSSGFDALRISFPSDTLTIKQLVERYPESHKWDRHEFFQLDSPSRAIEDLSNAMYMERELAEFAYFASRADPDRLPASEPVLQPGKASQITRSELIDMLSDVYVRLGVATGRKETEELVRGFESQACRQTGSGHGIS